MPDTRAELELRLAAAVDEIKQLRRALERCEHELDMRDVRECGERVDQIGDVVDTIANLQRDVGRLRAERDELRAGLREALDLLNRAGSSLPEEDPDDDYCACCGRWLDVEIDGYTGHAPDCLYVALRELAGVERG